MPNCTTRIGTEDGVLPIYCGVGDAKPLVGNSTGHSLCGFHVGTATRTTRNGTTIFTGPPSPEGVATPDNPDWYGMTGAEIVAHEFGGPTAVGREESDACQCGTPGCRVDHLAGTDYACDTW